MKRTACILIGILFLLSAAGCSLLPFSEDNTTSVPDPTASTSVLQPSPTTSTSSMPNIIYDGPLTTVSMPILTEQSFAQNGTLVFSYSHQDLNLILSDPTVADKVLVDYWNRTDFENSSARTVYDAAQTAYIGQADWSPYFYSIHYNPVRLDQSVLSLFGTEVSYTGSPRSASTALSVTYDLSSGSVLTLKEVLVPNYSAEVLCNLIVEALSSYAQDGLLSRDYKDIITDMFFTNRPVDTWYLSGSGLCFYFNPYEIGPYSSGTIIAEIPYEKLGAFMRDPYFPAERVDFIGDLQLMPYDDSAEQKYEQHAELVLDAKGSKLALTTEGTLFDLRIAYGSWSEDGAEFLPTATVFAAEAITNNSALIIQASGETLSKLCITYRSEGQNISYKPAK